MRTDLKPTRPEQIKEVFASLIDEHLKELVSCHATEMYEIEDFAKIMCVHPTHLSNTIKELTGTSPCGIFQPKILEVAKVLLAKPENSIREVAMILTFEPSQFTKWFKRLTGETPKMFRLSLSEQKYEY